jgi:hypothetical protein
MLEMSVKSVPGCLVLMAPRTIGDPVALTPGLGPHEDVLALGVAPPELLVLLALELAPDPPLLELLELLLPHAASSATRTTTASA